MRTVIAVQLVLPRFADYVRPKTVYARARRAAAIASKKNRQGNRK